MDLVKYRITLLQRNSVDSVDIFQHSLTFLLGKTVKSRVRQRRMYSFVFQYYFTKMKLKTSRAYIYQEKIHSAKCGKNKSMRLKFVDYNHTNESLNSKYNIY